jgi:hypothetical protein
MAHLLALRATADKQNRIYYMGTIRGRKCRPASRKQPSLSVQE